MHVVEIGWVVREHLSVACQPVQVMQYEMTQWQIILSGLIQRFAFRRIVCDVLRGDDQRIPHVSRWLHVGRFIQFGHNGASLGAERVADGLHLRAPQIQHHVTVGRFRPVRTRFEQRDGRAFQSFIDHDHPMRPTR